MGNPRERERDIYIYTYIETLEVAIIYVPYVECCVHPSCGDPTVLNIRGSSCEPWRI